uniref:Uncharacterized protein n=1 Tax=viral metagenome TaxID=1070528 RepID=A0A6M3INV5_9ZZZZ
MGRPKLFKDYRKVVSFSMDPELFVRVKEEAEVNSENVSSIIREALQRFIDDRYKMRLFLGHGEGTGPGGIKRHLGKGKSRWFSDDKRRKR